MILSFILLAVAAVVFFRRDRREDRDLKTLGKRVKVPACIGSAGLLLYRAEQAALRRIRGAEAEKPRSLQSEKDRKAERANLFGGIYLLLVIGAAAGVILGISEQGNLGVTELPRPAFGETAEVVLIASQAESVGEVRVEVAGKEPAEEEYEALFDEAFERAKDSWLGENETYSEVRRNLRFSEGEAAGILYRFRSTDSEVLSNRGTILAEELSESGTIVTVEVTLSYGTREKTYPLEVYLFPDAAPPEKTDLEAALEEADRRNRSDETMKLPASANGEAVAFSRKSLSPYALLGLVAVLAAVLSFLPASREKAELKKREESLTFAYAKAVSGLTAYIGAGMSIRMAWTRMAETYREEVGRNKRPKEYLYEEMLLSLNELNSGISEEEVYVRFGRRIGQHRYLKFGNLLAQNVRQGIAGLEKALEAESREAMEERRRLALKKGEEAGTKLLLPMMILLGIVIIVLVVPAFMMF